MKAYIVVFVLFIFATFLGVFLITFAMNEYIKNGTNYDVGTIMTCSIGGVLSLAIGITMLLAVLISALF